MSNCARLSKEWIQPRRISRIVTVRRGGRGSIRGLNGGILYHGSLGGKQRIPNSK